VYVLPFTPPGTLFLDVEGVPVTIYPSGVTLAWDFAEPRWFPIGSADRNGAPISAARFKERRLEELRVRGH